MEVWFLSFLRTFFKTPSLPFSITEHYRLILLFSFNEKFIKDTRVRKLRFLHFDYKVFSISEDFPNVNLLIL